MGDRMARLASVKTRCSQGGNAANWVGPFHNDAALNASAECPSHHKSVACTANGEQELLVRQPSLSSC